MTFRISRRQKQQLLDWAKEAGANECCGLIFCSGDDIFLQHTANVSPDPSSYFEIDPAALIAAEKAARAGSAGIAGYFHSHPNGLAEPSDEDAAMAAADGRTWLIIAGADITAWQKRNADGFTRVALSIEG